MYRLIQYYSASRFSREEENPETVNSVHTIWCSIKVTFYIIGERNVQSKRCAENVAKNLREAIGL